VRARLQPLPPEAHVALRVGQRVQQPVGRELRQLQCLQPRRNDSGRLCDSSAPGSTRSIVNPARRDARCTHIQCIVQCTHARHAHLCIAGAAAMLLREELAQRVQHRLRGCHVQAGDGQRLPDWPQQRAAHELDGASCASRTRLRCRHALLQHVLHGVVCVCVFFGGGGASHH
jgi:hypothetical protein